MTDRSAICIGGPLDGKRRFANGTHHSVPQLGGPTFRYDLQMFGVPQGAVAVWAPEGQTPFETLSLLIEAYEREKGKGDG